MSIIMLSPCLSPTLRRADMVPNITLTLPLDDMLSDIEGNLFLFKNLKNIYILISR